MPIPDAHKGAAAPRKAYSYLRFSTPEQSKGDSFRRQMSMAVAYASEHGLVLDQELTFHDVGVSGFRGQNAEAGRLAYFLEAVRSGQVPQGSVLLVEQLDRLSRLTPRRAVRVLEDIVETGVSVVTLTDRREYTAASMDNDHMDFIMSVLTFMRANEESATKSRRLKASWENKRANVASRPLTSRTPAWVRLSEDRQRLELVEERANLVRRIFRMAVDGIGQHRIAAAFNAEGIAPWGRGKFWQRSYIAKVLENPAVVGTLQPHVIEYDGTRKRRRPLDRVEGYFPPVVTEATFQTVRALRQAHGAAQRGRHAHAPITHMLAGLAACPKCGATMTRVAKGKRSRPAYVCTRAKTGAGCAYKSVPCEFVERALLHALPERLRALEGVAAGADLGDAVEDAQARVDDLRRAARNLLQSLELAPSATLARELREREGELEVAEAALEDLYERQEAATGRTIQARVEKALHALERSADERSAGDVNLALRGLFDRAVIVWPSHMIELAWKHGGTLTLPYVSFGQLPGPGWVWRDPEEPEEPEAHPS